MHAQNKSVNLYNNKRKVASRVRLVLKYALLILVAAILAYPFFYMFMRGFMTTEQIMRKNPVEYIPRPFVLGSWIKMFVQQNYVTYLLRTLAIVGFNIIAIPLSASLVAYAFAKCRFHGRSVLFFIMMGTLMLPGTVVQIPLFVLFAKFGWLNTILPLTIPNLFGGGAMNIFLLRQFMRSVPKEMDEASKIEGANRFQHYLYIIVPLCMPVLIFTMVGVFSAGWGDYYGPLIYISSEGKETLAYAVFKNAVHMQVSVEGEGLRMAAGAFMSIPPLILFFIFQRQLIEGVIMSGIKG